MELIDTASLVRGATIVDCAFSKNLKRLNPTVPELIGMVAAYAAKGGLSGNTLDLEKALGPEIAERMGLILALFNDRDGKGYWEQGPAHDDFHFTNATLAAMFPNVNAAYREVTKRWGANSA